MNRYFIKLAYNGTDYHGWQVQENANTVQEEIHKALETVLQEKVGVMGCGRTDTGVHAKEFYAHFELASPHPDLDQLKFRMNCLLPASIGVEALFGVAIDTHARFSATARTYAYHIGRVKDPFSEKRSYLFQHPLDLDKMNEAAATLLQVVDFTTFSKSKTQVKTNNCNVTFAQWEKRDDLLVFTIKADRFLRNMVRAVVGTLMMVGQNKLDLQQFEAIVQAKDRKLAGTSVPAEGLYLIKVDYPEGNLTPVKHA